MSNHKESKTYDLVEIALFAVVLVICSWISIPTAIPFTMQTFGIFLSICVLGGRKTTMVVFLYLLMGITGLPVFSGFAGGAGCLVGNTGGFLVGFFVAAFVAWGIEHFTGSKSYIKWVQMILCIVICYATGVLWYLMIIGSEITSAVVIPVMGIYVLPFIIPDILKMFAAYFLSKKLMIIVKNI